MASIATIGVYGFDRSTFLETLATARIELVLDVRQCMRRIDTSPFIPRKNVRGFVYEVETGRLREVT